jgi:hypothetical protein
VKLVVPTRSQDAVAPAHRRGVIDLGVPQWHVVTAGDQFGIDQCSAVVADLFSEQVEERGAGLVEPGEMSNQVRWCALKTTPC